MEQSRKTPVLKLKNVSKRFGATQALDDVSLDLFPGEVHALMGENGAGKSTLMKVLAGNISADSGTIEIDGKQVEISHPNDARRLGIAIIHQELNTVPEMTIAENLALGAEPTNSLGVLDRKRLQHEAREKLSLIGLDADINRPLGEFSVGMQQMVEIARASSEDAKILVLDEPTAALSRAETDELFRIIEEAKRNNVGLIYISHRMEEVWKLADRITVLRDGEYVGTRQRSEVTPDDIVKMMVGREITDLYAHSKRTPGDVYLEVKGLEGAGVGPVSLEVRKGEIVCLSGLIGAGRTEMARLIFGADKPTAGSIKIGGKAYVPDNPQKAIAKGISMVPEDRKAEGLFLDHTVRDNISLSSLARFSKGGVLNKKAIKQAVISIMEYLNLRLNAIGLSAKSLSGGNQQKCVLARNLLTHSDLLILDEPTRGVDVGSKREIYEMMDQLAIDGKAILMISSDLPEAIGVSDRVLVMRKGTIAAEIQSEEATEERVMAFATGTAKEGL